MYILVLFLSMHGNAVATTTIPDFKTLEHCQTAGEKVAADISAKPHQFALTSYSCVVRY